MPDPIQVERLYQELKIHFESILSVRHQYTLFRGFIDYLEGSFKKYETYIIQLIDDLPTHPNPLSWSGIDPENIKSNLELLENLNSILQLSGKSDNYQKVRENLAEVCLLMYSCLNEFDETDRQLKKRFGIYSLHGFHEKSKGIDDFPLLKSLHELLSFELNAHKSQQQNRFQKIIKEIEKLREEEKWKVLVPVAELYHQTESSAAKYCRLRKISVELYSETENHDELIWNMNIFGAEKPSIPNQQDFLEASRNLFISETGTKTDKFYKGGIRFELSNAVHDGNSANLAIAMLWYTQLLRASGQRQRYRISSQTAVTGNISSDGSILPVEPQTIHLKARAVFFSWAKTLVVPAGQSHLFEEELQKLRKKYPQRRLYLIGVHNLREVFFDRRVAYYEVQGRIKYYFSRIRKEQTKAALIPFIVVLLLIIARLVYGPIDMNPDTFHYEGSSLVIQNQYGSEVKRLEVGAQTASRYTSAGTIAGYPLAVLTDITGDGFNEVIFGKRNRLNQSNREVSDVTAISVSGDSTIWSRELLLNYDFPRQSGVTQEEMLIREMGLIETNNGPKLIVNANSYYYFQTILYLIDAETGEIEQEYLHIGHIRDMILEDINGDNQAEVLFTGINNAFWLAALGVLEIENFHGHSPIQGDYEPSGIDPAHELHYILIPKSVLAEYANPLMKYNEGSTIYYDIANETIRVMVEEARIPFRKEFGDVIISVSFTNDLMPQGVGTSDVYDIVARQLYEEGEISEIPDFDYFESYQDSLLYWDENKFVTTREYFQNQ